MDTRKALAVALFLAAAGCATAPHTRLSSGPPSSLPHGTPIGPPITTHTFTSLPMAPECQKPGVLQRATAIAQLSTRDVPGALAAFKAASPDVQKCLGQATGTSTESGVQQVAP